MSGLPNNQNSFEKAEQSQKACSARYQDFWIRSLYLSQCRTCTRTEQPSLHKSKTQPSDLPHRWQCNAIKCLDPYLTPWQLQKDYRLMCERLSNSIPKKLYKRIPSCLWGRQRFQGKVKVKLLSCVPFFATPWTVAYQASPSMGSKGEHKKKVSKKMNELTSLKKNFWDFPGGPVVKNLLFNARDMGCDPWSGN